MKKKKKKAPPEMVSMMVVNPYSAGIDISDKEHVVALPEGLCENRVRNGSDGKHRNLLEAIIYTPYQRGHRSVSGKCAACKKCIGSQGR